MVVVVDIHDVAVMVRTLYFPIPGRGIPPYVDLVVIVAMHHAMMVVVDMEQQGGIHGGHDHHILVDGNDDNNVMNLGTFRKIHNCQNYCVLRRPLVMEGDVVVVGRTVVPMIRIDYHILTDMYPVAVDRSSHFLEVPNRVVSFHQMAVDTDHHDLRMHHRTEDDLVDVMDEMSLLQMMTVVVRSVSFRWA